MVPLVINNHILFMDGCHMRMFPTNRECAIPSENVSEIFLVDPTKNLASLSPLLSSTQILPREVTPHSDDSHMVDGKPSANL